MKRDRKKGTGLYKHKPHSEETMQKIRDSYRRYLNSKKKVLVDSAKLLMLLLIIPIVSIYVIGIHIWYLGRKFPEVK